MSWKYAKACIIFLSVDNSFKSYLDFCGRGFVTCGILFTLLDEDHKFHLQFFYADSSIGRFHAVPNFKSSYTNRVIEEYNIDWCNIQGVVISSDASLVEKIYNLCRACHSTVKGYNQVDRVCSAVVPFYNPVDTKNIFDIDSFHSAQAVVLILRECLEACHPVMCRIFGVNSRIVTPDSLYTSLRGIPSPHDMCRFEIA